MQYEFTVKAVCARQFISSQIELGNPVQIQGISYFEF